MARVTPALNLGPGPGQNLGEWQFVWSCSGLINLFASLSFEAAKMLNVSVCAGPIPTAAHAGTTAVLDPARGPIVGDLTVGPTVGSAGAGATAAHPCPTAAGTLATG